jgi:2-C-methyl-D-erythritol 4-phosphate cytidylyltransferase
MKTNRNIALVVAAGTGERFEGDLPKQFVDLGGKQVVLYCLELFERCDLIDEIVLVVSEDYLVYASTEIVDKSGLKKIHKITAGGETRQESVHAGLSACHPGGDLVVIHDAVRPLLRMTHLRETIERAEKTGAAIMAVESKESVKLVDSGTIVKTLIRDTVWIAQTPQVFRYDRILDAHNRAEAACNEATDDAELYEQYCGPVAVVRGSYDNIKITTPGDLVLARELLRGIE